MGVCGECLANSDCAAGQTCKPAVIDALNNAVTGSICQ
jgi:Cys-rich repeat protein